MADTNLTVVVLGQCNSGKSTIAHEVARFLRMRGFDVQVEDEDTPRDGWEDMQVLRVEALRQRGVRVVVKSIHRAAAQEPSAEAIPSPS